MGGSSVQVDAGAGGQFDAGVFLRRVRRLARMSQRDLARAAGMPPSAVGRIEARLVANPGVRTVDRLVRAAGFELDVVVRAQHGRIGVAVHPAEGARDVAGRRLPAHVEAVEIGDYPGYGPVPWWAWPYKWSTLPATRRPRQTYTLRRSPYYRPALDPVTGIPLSDDSMLNWEQEQRELREYLRACRPGAVPRDGAHVLPGNLLAGAGGAGDGRQWDGGRGLGSPGASRSGRGPGQNGDRVSRIGVFAVQGDVREHLHALRAAGCAATAVRRPSELAAVDGLVLPGGESTTMIKLARTFDLLQPLRERIAAGMPVYGSCAGMILLADRLDSAGSPLTETIGGLDITVRRNAFGRQVDSFEEDIAIDGVPGDPVRAVFIRAPWVQHVGPRATPLGSTAEGHVVAVRQGMLLATSFHPEMTGDGRVHAYFCAMVAGLV